MKILVVNDDGIHSEGILALALMLYKKNHDVTVVAPAGNCSAFAHSISIHKELPFVREHISDCFEAYSLGGTPADCVKFAIHYFTDRKFDLVCSGINVGSNLGSDVVYSGTVSAGIEANAMGYKSMAFSCTAYKDIDFAAVADVCSRVFDAYSECLDKSYTLSVNTPNVAFGKLNGVKVTKLGVQLYTDGYVNTRDNMFKLVGEPVENQDNDEDCDVEWSRKNYVTVTPVLCDKTAYSAIDRIKTQAKKNF